jgi:hypothetical protein
MNAAVAVFNKTIMHQVVSDARAAQDDDDRESRKGLDAVISSTQANDNSAASSSSRRNLIGKRRTLTSLYPDNTGELFARFIFGFNSIFETLQKIHIVPVAALEAAKVLKRLRVPRTPPLESNDTSQGDRRLLLEQGSKENLTSGPLS